MLDTFLFLWYNTVYTMEKNQFIFELLEAINQTDFNVLTLECENIKIHIERSDNKEELAIKPMLITSPEDIKNMEKQEQKTTDERIAEYDEELLSELDFFPELKGQLLRNNIICVDNNNTYQYVDKEIGSVNETNS